MQHEDAVPTIDRDALMADLRRALPNATIAAETINPDYGSWEIAVRGAGRWVNIAWGPLSGFGATDLDNVREDTSFFQLYDYPLQSGPEAVAFAVRVLTGSVA